MTKDNEGTPPVIGVVEQIKAARGQELLIHDIRDPKRFPGVTEFLAKFGIRTTCEPQYPDRFTVFRRVLATRRQLGTLAANATEAIHSANNPDFNRAIKEKRLGSMLFNLFAD